MADLPTEPQFGDYASWPGRRVLDPAGESVGAVREIYLDRETHQPEWVLVEVDGGDARFVPLADATIEEDAIRVAHHRETVAAAPGMGTESRIDTQQERELYAHYGVPHSDKGSSTVLPEPAPTGEREPASEPEPQAEPEPRAEPEPPLEPSPVLSPTPTSPAPQAAAGSTGEDVPSPVTDAPTPPPRHDAPWQAPPPLPPPAAEPPRSRPVIPILAAVAAALALLALIWRLRD
jgi:hypothetical protein